MDERNTPTGRLRLVGSGGEASERTAGELRTGGHEVRTATGVESADDPVDCTVVLHGGDVDGVEAVRRIRERDDDHPVVVVADGDERLAGEVVEAGATAYVPADSQRETLLRRVAGAIEEGQAGDGTGATTDPPAWVRDRLRTLEAVLDAIPDLVIVYDADGEYREVLTDQQVLTFRSPTELVGRTVHEVLDAETADLICDAIERTLSTGDVETVEYRVDLAGESFWFEGLLSSIEREAEDRVVFVARDVTRRKRRERDLRRQNQRLDEFASVVSHDLRNPLQVAEGHLELAREECDSERLDDVERAHDRMRQLIDDVLSLARQGETVDDPGPVSIPDVVADARAHSAVEDVVVADGLPEVRADAERLTALFENLFRNSVEHGATADGGPTVRVGPIDGGFYVADDGPGIPADQREAVFEPGNSEGEGTGFGLAIVRRIAEAHGWSVRATESESGGARFEFTGVETA